MQMNKFVLLVSSGRAPLIIACPGKAADPAPANAPSDKYKAHGVCARV